MSRIVEHCEASTISEAWALVLGPEGKLDDGEISLMLRHGRKQFADLVEDSVFVVQKSSGDKLPPFWNNQVRWGGHAGLARFGHRFLSVHCVPTEESPYESYQDSVGAPLEKWLGIAGQAVDPGYPVERTGFGYTNTFTFGETDFDISRYFRLGIFMSLGPPEDPENPEGLEGLEVNFKFQRHGFHHQISLSVESQPNEKVRVLTKLFVERGSEGVLDILDPATVLKSVAEAHEIAKKAFFDFATEETHALMKARYVGD